MRYEVRQMSRRAHEEVPQDEATAVQTDALVTGPMGCSFEEPEPCALSPRIRRILYLSHFGNQFSMVVWEVCLAIWMAQITNYKSLLLVSTYGVTVRLFAGIGSPLIGNRMDRMAAQGRRMDLCTRLLVSETTSVLLATLACSHFLVGTGSVNSHDPATGTIPWTSSSSIVWLGFIHVFGAVAQLLDGSFLVAVERDWIVKISESPRVNQCANITRCNGNDSKQEEAQENNAWLSETNVVLKQLDLSAKVLAPVISGFVLSAFPELGILWVGLVNIFALVVEYNCMTQIANLVPELNSPVTTNEEHVPEDTQTHNEEISDEFSDSSQNDGTTTWVRPPYFAWGNLMIYFRQPVALPGLGLALLYFNVLTFSGMMTAYLVARGMSLHTIGIWRGVSSTVGLLGTFVYHWSAKHYTLKFTALWSVTWEFFCLSLTFASVFVSDDFISLALLIGGVLLSRIGLWVYDIAVTQMFQQSVVERERSQVGGTQMSLNSWMELLPLGLAIIYHKPGDFCVLIVGGYLAVGLAVILYFFGFYSRNGSYQRFASNSTSSDLELAPVGASSS